MEKQPAWAEWFKMQETSAGEYLKQIEKLQTEYEKNLNTLYLLSRQIELWMTNLKNFLK